MSEETLVKGACLCGGVQFELIPPLRDALSCHCSQCRKTSGHYWSATSVPISQFRMRTSDTLKWYSSSATARRGFCATCGSSLFWEPNPTSPFWKDNETMVYVSCGSLSAPTGIKVESHIFTSDKGDYYNLTCDKNLSVET